MDLENKFINWSVMFILYSSFLSVALQYTFKTPYFKATYLNLFIPISFSEIMPYISFWMYH